MPDKLQQHNIVPQGSINRNLPALQLAQTAIELKEVTPGPNQTVVVYTGKYTGRSPKDKFIVDDSFSHDKINWGKTHQPISPDIFENLYKKMSAYLSSVNNLYIFDGFAGADEEYKIHVRVVSEYAYQALFSSHLLRQPTQQELQSHSPQLTILSAPGCLADPSTDNTNSEAFIVMNLAKNIVLIGGTKYSGEIKKSIFSFMNIMLPQKGVFPMHCSANMGHGGRTALFFGLSGTGKTTLSADPNRQLIGDDEHGWSKNGIFNFEGGCYAKCIKLHKENEPQIWNAIRDGALLENVALKENGDFDFDSSSFTENTRAAYPLSYIENAVLAGVGGHPSYIIFLTADASGVLPPVAKLDHNAAMYHFMSGYTSKLAGTERGVTEPKATFSSFFGDPFMSLKPMVYANLLDQYTATYKTNVYLVNTGWSGGAYGVGQRISIKDTRSIVTAILEGKLDNTSYRRDPIFNLEIPESVPGVNANILNPRELWQDKTAYDAKAKELANLFIENFKKFKDIPQKIVNAGPVE